MATQTEGPRKTYKAAADFSAKQFYIVELDSDENTCKLAAAASDFLLGTIENKPKANENASVLMRHAAGATGKVICGGTVTAGAFLTTDNAGKAIVTTTTGNEVLGRALQAGDTGDIIEYMPTIQKYAATT